MTYKRFEDIPVWNDAIDLARQVLELSDAGTFRRLSGFKDQVERAVVSVSNNIAEGSERGTNGELLTFLYIAKGSVAEVRSMLRLLERLGMAPTPAGVEKPKRLSESISRQLGGRIEAIKNSGYSGNRSQTTTDRVSRDQQQKREALLASLHELQEVARSRHFPRPS